MITVYPIGYEEIEVQATGILDAIDRAQVDLIKAGASNQVRTIGRNHIEILVTRKSDNKRAIVNMETRKITILD